MTMRVMPPADGLHPTITVNGRSYTCALGSTIDVPDADGVVMLHNGWSAAATGGAGATAARPINPPKNTYFHDTTLGFNIVWDGRTWRNPTSGAAV